jgi:hypothetical protein
MTRFSVGEQVTIRYGRHESQKATIIKSQPEDAYMVKVEDGTVLFFSSKGLEKEKERVIQRRDNLGASALVVLPGPCLNHKPRLR